MTITREDPRFWDVRTLERKIRRGIITKKEFEKHLKTVADAGDKAAPPDTDDDDQK